MTIDRHSCLGGGLQLGDSFDCPKCWAELIKSLYPAAETPHLIINDPGKTVDLDETLREVSPPRVEHHTMADTEPVDDGPGGRWVVTCSCGWTDSGRYARDTGEAVALRLANLKGDQHEKDPGEDGHS
jgi:hypothetical protein